MKNRIAERRKLAGLSQQKLADACDTVKSKISTLENGKQQLTQVWMERISKALTDAGVPTTPQDLLPENTEYEQPDINAVLDKYIQGFEDNEALKATKDAFIATYKAAKRKSDNE